MASPPARSDSVPFFSSLGRFLIEFAAGQVRDGDTFQPARTITAAAAYRARDGRRLAVAGVGIVSLDGFHLSDVMHVPGLPVGVVLVSVMQLAERGYLVMFGGGRCHVKDQSTGNMVGNGRLHSQDGLYHLEFLKIPPDTKDTTAP